MGLLDRFTKKDLLCRMDALDAAGGQQVVDELGDQYERDQVKEFQSTNAQGSAVCAGRAAKARVTGAR